MIKPNMNVSHETQKYVVQAKKEQAEHAGAGVEYGGGKIYRDSNGKICYRIRLGTKEEAEQYDSIYVRSKELYLENRSIIGYQGFRMLDDGTVDFVFGGNKNLLSIRDAAKQEDFSSLVLFHDLLVELLCYRFSLSVDTVFFNTETKRIWLLPISGVVNATEQDVLQKAADVAIQAENKCDTTRYLRPRNPILKECLEYYPCERPGSIAEVLKRVRAILRSNNEEVKFEEDSFKSDFKKFMMKLRSIKLRSIKLPHFKFRLEEKETEGQVKDTDKPVEVFDR